MPEASDMAGRDGLGKSSVGGSEAKSQPQALSLGAYAALAVMAAVVGFLTVYLALGWPEAGPQPGGGQKSPSASLERNIAAAPGRAEQAPGDAGKPVAGAPLAAFAKGEVATFLAHAEPKSLTAFSFRDGSGRERTLADWSGRVVLINLWATWCTPCRHEMPSLDRLQAALGGADFEVVAISIDRGEPARPQGFLQEIKTNALAFYHDPSARLGTRLGVFGMPATLLIGRDGRELGRLVGPAEWDSAEALALIRVAIGAAGSQ